MPVCVWMSLSKTDKLVGTKHQKTPQLRIKKRPRKTARSTTGTYRLQTAFNTVSLFKNIAFAVAFLDNVLILHSLISVATK